jgi:hypothetical protein
MNPDTNMTVLDDNKIKKTAKKTVITFSNFVLFFNNKKKKEKEINTEKYIA